MSVAAPASLPLRIRRASAAGLVVVVCASPAAAAGTARDPAPLRLGDRGAAVAELRQRLATLRYLPPDDAGRSFDRRTWHAVVALQGWSRIARDGIVGPQTRRALARARIPVPWSRRRGIEVHLDRQVMLLLRDGRVRRAVHVSTGADGRTPVGRYRIRSRQRRSWSTAFRVWLNLAQYFHRGYAIHQYDDVPSYPASHGCVRVPAEEAGVVWRFGRVGMRVWTTGT